MVFTVPEVIVIATLAVGGIGGLTWTHRECKRQQLQELRKAREIARDAEMQVIRRRIYAEMTRNKTMQELKAIPIAKQNPIRKVCGVLASAEAQALWK